MTKSPFWFLLSALTFALYQGLLWLLWEDLLPSIDVPSYYFTTPEWFDTYFNEIAQAIHLLQLPAYGALAIGLTLLVKEQIDARRKART